MKLYMKQKVFSWNDKFTIKNENGEDCYFAEGELFSWGKKLHVMDSSQREVAYIEEKLLSFHDRHMIYLSGSKAAEVVREFTLFHPKYTIEGPAWTVDGDFWEHNYSIKRGLAVIASVTKEWFTWGDSYALEIYEHENEVLVLAVVLAIDSITASNNSAAASASV